MKRLFSVGRSFVWRLNKFRKFTRRFGPNATAQFRNPDTPTLNNPPTQMRDGVFVCHLYKACNILQRNDVMRFENTTGFPN